MAALVIAEHDNVQLKPSTLHAVSAAAQCSSEVDILVAGFQAYTVAEAASRISGVRAVLVADGLQLQHGLAEEVAEQVLSAAPAYSHLLVPATAFGKNLAPRVAARLDIAQISDVTKVIEPTLFERPIYAGNAIATVRTRDDKIVMTVRTTAFDAAPLAEVGVVVTPVDAVVAGTDARFEGQQITKSERPELTAARVIVSGGRALGSSDRFESVLTPLADKLGAAIGASRAAVDAGYAPNDLQVGQTGKIVAPELYVACGISGAIQHLAGMKDSKVIVAINKDEEAPIFSVADFGLVADLFEAVPAMAASL
jgi:electron transfer flavoprotein alpha subunit